ncbi:hypothetical protein C8F04DRAFT_1080650 [Mycena alexandri]|uniref:Fe2OG dioxygenase domain-containing protein n=1 Tax=Mycena alexandri TaxID=1745969 RepID=A0AAD6T7F0_9AGAR|nr:hypothetical protein C8F04DRAFT_1080650 [Mycena alexandri]
MHGKAEFHGGEFDSAIYSPPWDSGGDERLRARLKIATNFERPTTTEDSPDSLFDEGLAASPIPSDIAVVGDMEPASSCAPPIPGLFFTPSLLLPPELADQITEFCLKQYFNRPGVNQIMLFGAASDSTPWSGMPPILLELLASMSVLLQPSLPPEIHALLFPRTPTHARQAILNLYHPGEGITPHVDLLKRFGDGIVGLSLGSSCVMQFARVEEADDNVRPKQLFLPERTMIVLSGDARYAWTHGIEKRTTDLVGDAEPFRIVERGVRLSITFRWLLASEDVVGLEVTEP